MVGKGEAERWLEPCIMELKARCDEVAVCLNNAGEKEKRLCQKLKCIIYEDNREWGKFQPKIKQNFLEKIGYLKPDWILWIDADEFLDPRLNRQKLEELASKKYDVSYFFWFLELWDRTNQCREDILFDDIRFFKYLPQYGLTLKQWSVHCGLYPEKVASWGTHTNFYVKHYGLLKEEDRRKKYERYKKYDPDGKYLPKSWYEGLLAKNPPLRKIEELIKEINNLKFKFREKPMPTARRTSASTAKRVWRFINPNGQLVIFDETEDAKAEAHANQRRNIKGWEFLSEDIREESGLGSYKMAEVPIVKEEENVPAPFECKVCGFMGKNDRSIRLHQVKKGHR